MEYRTTCKKTRTNKPEEKNKGEAAGGPANTTGNNQVGWEHQTLPPTPHPRDQLDTSRVAVLRSQQTDHQGVISPAGRGGGRDSEYINQHLNQLSNQGGKRLLMRKNTSNVEIWRFFLIEAEGRKKSCLSITRILLLDKGKEENASQPV